MANVEMLGANVEMLGNWWDDFLNKLITAGTEIAVAAVTPAEKNTIINSSTMTAKEKVAALAATPLTQDEKDALTRAANAETNYTPWIIGGSVVAGLLVLALVMKK